MKMNKNLCSTKRRTVTITFGDVAENGVGMEQIGEMAQRGFSREEMEECEIRLRSMGFQVEKILLSAELDNALTDHIDSNLVAEARSTNPIILIVRKGVNQIFSDPENGADCLLAEQQDLNWDVKKMNKGKVMNSLARHNLCYGAEASDPNYDQKRGRVIAFESVPLLNHVREWLPTVLGESAEKLNAEGNLYYDIQKCAIGFHGDGERRKVIAFRLGETFPLHYQWYYKSQPVGLRMTFMLNHGDFYIMSDKSVGNDWKIRNQLTLRHAAGSADKYIDAPLRRKEKKKEKKTRKRERDE